LKKGDVFIAASTIELAGQDWDVALKSLYCADGDHHYEIPDRKAVMTSRKLKVVFGLPIMRLPSTLTTMWNTKTNGID
jgi:hypothetical protein